MAALAVGEREKMVSRGSWRGGGERRRRATGMRLSLPSPAFLSLSRPRVLMMYSGQDLVMPNKSMRSAARRTKAVLSAVVVGIGLTALITLLYSSTNHARSQSFMLDETSTDAPASDGVRARMTREEFDADSCYQAAEAAQEVEKGRGEGGVWDVPLPPVEKKVLQPQFAAKYGEAAAAASQRMFNPVRGDKMKTACAESPQVTTDKNGDQVSEADARSIKARYGLIVPGSEDVFNDKKSAYASSASPSASKIPMTETYESRAEQAPSWFYPSSFLPASSVRHRGGEGGADCGSAEAPKLCRSPCPFASGSADDR
eukprot:760273-Hanusia_phi.AAC.2